MSKATREVQAMSLQLYNMLTAGNEQQVQEGLNCISDYLNCVFREALPTGGDFIGCAKLSLPITTAMIGETVEEVTDIRAHLLNSIRTGLNTWQMSPRKTAIAKLRDLRTSLNMAIQQLEEDLDG